MRGDGPVTAAFNVGELTDILSGFAFKSEQFTTDPNEGMPLIRIRDLKSNETACRYVGDFDPAYVIKRGDIVVGMDGEFLAVRWAGADALLNQRVLRIKPSKPGLLDEEYLFYRIQPELERLERAITGTTVKHLSTKDIKRLVWDLPPLEEQRQIAEVLRSVDDALIAHEGVLEHLARVKAAAVERFIDEARQAEAVLLSEITASMDSGWSPDCENLPAAEDQWAVLKTSAVTWAGYHDDQNKRLPDTLPPRPGLSVEVGDILITRAGPADRTGVVAMVDETAGRRMLSDKIIRIRVEARRAVPLTVATMLGSDLVQRQIGRVKSGMAASQTNISQRIVAGLEIPLPPLQAQQRFASFMETVAKQAKLSATQRDRLVGIKARLAADLLSGRVRVPA